MARCIKCQDKIGLFSKKYDGLCERCYRKKLVRDKLISKCPFFSPVIRQTINPEGSISSFVISPDGEMVAIGGYDGSLRVYNTKNGNKNIFNVNNHSLSILSIAFSKDSRFIVSGGRDKVITVFDLKNPDHTRTLKGHQDWVNSVCLFKDSSSVISGGADKDIYIWSVEQGTIQRKIKNNSNVDIVAISPNGEFIASGDGLGHIKLWSVQSGKCIHEFSAHSFWVSSLAFTGDGKYLISCSRDMRIRIWDINNFSLYKEKILQVTKLKSVDSNNGILYPHLKLAISAKNDYIAIGIEYPQGFAGLQILKMDDLSLAYENEISVENLSFSNEGMFLGIQNLSTISIFKIHMEAGDIVD